MPKGVYPRKSKLDPPKRKRGRPPKQAPEEPPVLADYSDPTYYDTFGGMDVLGGAMEEFCGMTTRFWTDFGERLAGQARAALRGD